MFLKKKIAASSIAEVVIAVSIIALCFGIASLIFVRLTKVSVNYQDVKLQTEIQSALWEKMHTNSSAKEWGDVEIDVESNVTDSDSIGLMLFRGNTGNVIWSQECLND